MALGSTVLDWTDLDLPQRSRSQVCHCLLRPSRALQSRFFLVHIAEVLVQHAAVIKVLPLLFPLLGEHKYVSHLLPGRSSSLRL